MTQTTLTPRAIRGLINQAARTDDAVLALHACKLFTAEDLWTSTAHYQPMDPDGTEKLLQAKRPGTCSLCHVEFAVGAWIRWRSRVDCHASCWDLKFALPTPLVPSPTGGGMVLPSFDPTAVAP